MMRRPTERPQRPVHAVAAALLVGLLAACSGGAPPAAQDPAAGESWSLTAWGERFELFAECDPLVAGQTATAFTHVTVLAGFTPLPDGAVEVILRQGSGELRFRAAEAVRPGIFAVDIEPRQAGEYELALRVVPATGEAEEVRGGRVRVGTGTSPGGPLAVPAPRGATAGGEPLPFLKEEQWRSQFATAWVRASTLKRAVEGLARVRPVAGGEATLTAPLDGVIQPRPWPYPGQRFDRGATVLQLVPRVAAERSLSTLGAEAAALATELTTARSRRDRLQELLALEATSRREMEEADARVATLEARLAAAEEDLAVARSARQGGGAGALALRAPLAGEVMAVSASPGEAVAAGAALIRLVQTDPLWLDVALSPEAARRVEASAVSGVVLRLPSGPALEIGRGLRLISVAPAMDEATGSVAALVEVPAGDGLRLGTVVDAQLLLAEEEEGIVVPASALVDDGGVPVVYLQLSGERFARQPVEVVERQGGQVRVDGLLPGQRLVTRGGEAIRRSSLLTSGASHGHVH